ncbi:MAG TPA: TonB-dependent receptor [Chitinophagaceae bacterium]|nr:TonB-dependent receptor [Chitinophagaceae bacterium]
MRRVVLFIAALLMIVCKSVTGYAQETTSEIQGIVTDDKGAALAGATVVATHQPTGTKYSTTTRKDGRYNLPNLRIGGPYEVKITYVGFQEDKQDNVTLLLGQEFKADFKLTAASTTLTEVVVATRRVDKVFNNSHTGSQEIISRSQIERLPSVSRSLQDFAKLEPTASSTSFGQSFGGRSSQYNNLTVDGANFNNSFGLSGTLGGQTNSQPISLEAIEQIQVSTSPYDVTQGGFTGAGINSVTRSGTNQFKGSVYTALKGAGTQGYHVDNVDVVKTPLSFNLRGFTVGGPIIKNKLFFFISGEQVRQQVPATSYTASDAGHPAVTGSVSRANRDSLNALIGLLDKYADGYNPGAFEGYNFTTNSDKITAKLDFNINKNNTLSVKYNYLKSYADQFPSGSRPNNGTSLVTSGSGASNNTAMPFYSSGYRINNNFNILIAELNTRISNKASNKLQVGYTALRDFRSQHSNSQTMPFVDILDGAGNIFTSFGYEMYTYNNLLNTDVFQFSDIFKLYKGAHELTFGTQDYYRKYKNAFAPGYQGVYQFNSLNDFRNSLIGGAANSRNYYLQYSALKDGSFPFAFAGSTELGFFAQDKWRVSKDFTVTYGLRVDMTIFKQDFTDNPYFDALPFKDGQTYNIGKAPGNAVIVSPRLGFNWDVLGNKSFQMRGGAGIFSGPPPFVWISNQASNNGIQFGAVQTIGTPPTAGIPPVTNNNGPIIPGTGTAFNTNIPRPPAGVPNTSYSTALVDNNFKYPTVVKTNLAFDKKLGNDWSVTLEGSYSKDINSVYYSNLNLNETNGFALAGTDTRTRYTIFNGANTVPENYASYKSNKYYYNKPSVLTAQYTSRFENNTVADPTLGTAILMKNSKKGYAYTATARLEKTFKNLFASVAYTFSKAKNIAEGGSTASSLWSARAVSNTDPNGDNMAYASYYQPHRVIAFASYRFEYAKHFATSIGLVFEAAPAGVTSYIYANDLNGDGNTNDLVYVPKSASEISLIAAGSYNANTHTGSTTGTTADPRTSAQAWTQLDNFIKQDHYLNFHRGQYAEANAVVMPFFKKLDMNITQDIYFFTGKNADRNKHTLKLSLDVLNVGNFLNRNWGLVKTPTLSSNASGFQLLTFEGLAADGKTPLYSFPYQDAGSTTSFAPRTNSYTYNTGITSRWQMQFGIRYLFN